MKFIFILLSVNLLNVCQQRTDKSSKTAVMQQEIIAHVADNDIHAVKALLEQSVAVNTQDQQKRNLLLIATINKHADMAELLIHHGADVNMQANNLDSPFLYAGASGQTQLVKLYLKHGARFDVFNRYHGSALIPACERGHIETVQVLANTKGFPIDHVNNLGWTALLEAIVLGDGSERYQAVVQILKDAGADLHLADRNGKTPLQLAHEMGFEEIVRILQE